MAPSRRALLPVRKRPRGANLYGTETYQG